MENITRTAYFSALQSAMVRGGKYKWLPFSTFNQHFDVLNGVYPPDGQYPILNFIALGRGALRMHLGADNEADPQVMQHLTTDSGLFKFMPFVLRRTDDDLPTERRNRYAMRVLLPINGINYWAYYLRVVDFASPETQLLIKRKLPNGEIKIDPFVPDQSNLTPTPVELSDGGANLLAGYSVMSSTTIALPLDEFDITEIRNASKIIKGVGGKATISEVVCCTGAFQQINAQGPNGTFPFNEAIGVQPAAFIKALWPLDFLNKKIDEQLEIGISEPLFRLEGVNA